MAISLTSDMKVYNEQFFGGMTEVLAQAVNDVAGASRGAIAMGTNITGGDYQYKAFFKKIASLVTRQDITSTSAATELKAVQDEEIKVKLHRKIGPLSLTRKAFNMIGESPELGMFVWGQQTAKDVLAEMVNTSLLAARVAIANQSALTNDITGATIKTINNSNLLRTLGKLGDRSNSVVAWVMHSTQFFDLAAADIEDQLTGVASEVIRIVNVPSLGRPIIITDSDSLIATADTPDSYYVLGLTQQAISCETTEDQYVTVQEITGAEQIYNRVQGEWAFNLGLKGFKWDVGNGGANPDNTALGTGSNWDLSATSYKDAAGVVLKCQAAS